MPQIINTNLPSLNAQRNLNTSQTALSQALQRLSSGLRINSAKDDAAGLAIAERMTAQVRGLNQAARNANDGISLSQTAEGALGEIANLTQRMRELAIQSANATNSATDRTALQSEVNQLKQELSRIATSTTFNSKKLLDGTLQTQQFQVGAEANQIIQVSVRDARASGLGDFSVNSSVDTTATTNGIQANFGLEAASKRGYVTADGTQVGKVQAAGTTNGYAATVITTTSASGATGTVTTVANASAKATATQINAASIGVTASALNKVVLNASGTADATDADAITVSDGTTTATYTVATSATATNAGLAAAINSALNASNIYANVNSSGTVDVVSTNGADIQVALAKGATTTGSTAVTVQGLNDVAATSVTNATTRTAGGRLDLYALQGTSLATSGSVTLLTAAPTFVAVGNTDASGGNGAEAQTLTLTGPSGNANASLAQNDSAFTIAATINQFSGTTGITASARSTATLSSLSAAGTVSFGLQGSNSSATTISVNVSSTSNLIDLVTAINAQAGDTGVTANLNSSNGVVLTQAEGYDIRITNFAHSAAVDYGVASTPSTFSRIAAEQSIQVTGGEGQLVTLYDGGTRTAANSTVVGGNVKFSGLATYNVSSSIAGTVGSLFSGVASSANAATLNSVTSADVSSVNGANDAIAVFDSALAQVSSIRADLGAVQNRFESTIANLQTISENVSAARSRVRDADFAAETSALTRAQILQQAGVAILAQANALPNNVLALLRG